MPKFMIRMDCELSEEAEFVVEAPDMESLQKVNPEELRQALYNKYDKSARRRTFRKSFITHAGSDFHPTGRAVLRIGSGGRIERVGKAKCRETVTASQLSFSW